VETKGVAIPARGVRIKAPPGILVQGNEVLLDNKRLIIKWVEDAVPAA